MSRMHRIALFAALALLVAVSGTVLANRSPDQSADAAPVADEHEGESGGEVEAPPTDDEIAHARGRLTANEIDVNEDVFADLAARYGVGGAVRIVAWADETDTAFDVITAMRDGNETTPGMGWGKIARELGVHPGIGSIMGNGRGDPPGQERNAGD